ncbi:hypothetical protein P171DRAFT_518697 [Karstenula rhodostoma CBS 690.94]|uniref:Uncharacterized protein n=1 Tax=Karstenula rhodostoma CBS 690.94 TaxID=1392251 RepID=A0A9P4PNT0_9PLEO|nr:hypothetical protein P171DRAFT_518697 [Karstenula rhodostoma CBS 690.94]
MDPSEIPHFIRRYTAELYHHASTTQCPNAFEPQQDQSPSQYPDTSEDRGDESGDASSSGDDEEELQRLTRETLKRKYEDLHISHGSLRREHHHLLGQKETIGRDSRKNLKMLQNDLSVMDAETITLKDHVSRILEHNSDLEDQLEKLKDKSKDEDERLRTHQQRQEWDNQRNKLEGQIREMVNLSAQNTALQEMQAQLQSSEDKIAQLETGQSQTEKKFADARRSLDTSKEANERFKIEVSSL